MAFVELLLGWAILTFLGIGSIVASEPFWGPRRSRERTVVIRIEAERSQEGAAGRDERRAA